MHKEILARGCPHTSDLVMKREVFPYFLARILQHPRGPPMSALAASGRLLDRMAYLFRLLLPCKVKIGGSALVVCFGSLARVFKVDTTSTFLPSPALSNQPSLFLSFFHSFILSFILSFIHSFFLFLSSFFSPSGPHPRTAAQQEKMCVDCTGSG